ncbi:unnamed protein product [Eruca vesicaria subsp. sativa]|uniref:Uncharacterized protein n=1 Tax=Eruca vesicaria subsp. sativa TaxID=29727 RepID=A0ABC8L356_ERUVS|nr:unnamed protein product [Eruca vesicaria subsp. sativa]
MKKAKAWMKHITSAFKTRLLMLSLVKDKKLGFRSISNKIHNLLGHADQDQDNGHNNQDESKAIILYNNGVSTVPNHESYDVQEEGNDKSPDMTHTLFEGEEDFEELEKCQGSSVIDMVRSSKEEEGESFKLEDEIDHVADLFISRFHKQMKLQKLLSFKRYQEMLARGT